jgi:hypothetical protein
MSVRAGCDMLIFLFILKITWICVLFRYFEMMTSFLERENLNLYKKNELA